VGSDSCARRVGGWAIGGGIAAVALCVAFDRVAPAGVAMLPVVLVPGAVVALTDASPSNIGWEVAQLPGRYLADFGFRTLNARLVDMRGEP
jgi:hypothetical protein